jgi:hypothetical protein
MRCPERWRNGSRSSWLPVSTATDVELGEDRREQFVLLGATVIGEIARREHYVGPQLHRD